VGNVSEGGQFQRVAPEGNNPATEKVDAGSTPLTFTTVWMILCDQQMRTSPHPSTRWTTRVSTRWTTRVSFPQILKRYAAKFALQKALQSVAGCKLTLDERVGIRRVGTLTGGGGRTERPLLSLNLPACKSATRNPSPKTAKRFERGLFPRLRISGFRFSGFGFREGTLYDDVGHSGKNLVGKS